MPTSLGKGQGQQVKDVSYVTSDSEKIYVLDGANIRNLRDGLGLCSPGIIPRNERASQPFWETIKKSLLTVCNKRMFSKNDLRSPNLLTRLKESF